MQYLDLAASPLLAGSALGLRPLARQIARGFRTPDPGLVARARQSGDDRLDVGRVHSGGAWRDVGVYSEIGAALDPALRTALRLGFEWYRCRGAFFHTDAHYADVLFGVWYLSGPPVDIVFARAGLRIAADFGTLVIFDPFEVHGVLNRGSAVYRPDDYVEAETSVFVGFELDLQDAVRGRFGMTETPAEARVVSSATRVSAATGTFE